MPLGSQAVVFVCQRTAPKSALFVAGTSNQIVCTLPDGNNGFLVARPSYVLSPESEAFLDAVAAPFDYGLAAGLWSLAFTFVVGLYLVAKSVGMIVSMVRR
ncbi:hypothetical protein [Massilia pseudoviolaceinigra]|uniref:hypothetical protein n=1 Tax=Massilia pseudoviolaceinigra TaxID=3057165 RepID=UPI002796C92F|nr:hypothetical protein [Massilia sp. CCM 9206]MDQ1921569.1 hypothetical protein [Massilia sp. CCM 9206]